jgi:hypothetical protein
MPVSRWKKFFKNYYEIFREQGTIISLLSTVVALTGVYLDTAFVLYSGIGFLALIFFYCAYKSYPPVMPSAADLIGEAITLDQISEIDPPVSCFAIIGITQSGKSTFLNHVRQNSEKPNRTNELYAEIVTLQKSPPAYIALLDGDGNQYPHQFKLAGMADILLVFIDHNSGDSKTNVSLDRKKKHSEFLEQLEYYLKDYFEDKKSLSIKHVHFLLNKRDLWENSSKSHELKIWFSELVGEFKKLPFSMSVSESFHSNNYASDISSIMQILNERAE